MNLFVAKILLVSEPTFRTTNNGTPVMNFNAGVLASDKSQTILPCVIFGPNARKQYENIRKMSTAVIEGELKTRKYTRYNNDGTATEVAELEVVVSRVVWIDNCGELADQEEPARA